MELLPSGFEPISAFAALSRMSRLKSRQEALSPSALISESISDIGQNAKSNFHFRLGNTQM
jgi:hypothetical protein